MFPVFLIISHLKRARFIQTSYFLDDVWTKSDLHLSFRYNSRNACTSEASAPTASQFHIAKGLNMFHVPETLEQGSCLRYHNDAADTHLSLCNQGFTRSCLFWQCFCQMLWQWFSWTKLLGPFRSFFPFSNVRIVRLLSCSGASIFIVISVWAPHWSKTRVLGGFR